MNIVYGYISKLKSENMRAIAFGAALKAMELLAAGSSVFVVRNTVSLPMPVIRALANTLEQLDNKINSALKFLSQCTAADAYIRKKFESLMKKKAEHDQLQAEAEQFVIRVKEERAKELIKSCFFRYKPIDAFLIAKETGVRKARVIELINNVFNI